MPELLLEEPKANVPKPPQKRRRRLWQRGLCILCAALAVTTLGLYGWHTAKKTLQSGVAGKVCEYLLPYSLSLGPLTLSAIEPDLHPTPALPRIYYIPREEILDRSYAEKAELEQKIFDLYAFTESGVPKDAHPIRPADLSTDDASALQNDTSYVIDMEEITKAAVLRAPESITGNPLVLIVHTHGTEGFSAEGSTYYSESYNHPRTEDVSQNVVAVGKVLADALNKKGIPTLHCETMHDKESYIAAYDRSAESIRMYLEKYPSIRYVFDVHRDSLIRSDLTKLRPVTLHGGEPSAQIMMIVGSSEKSGIDYDWQANLILAEAIQQRLVTDTLGMARQLYLRGATYNQQHAKYGLLLEIGACGNSLAEAKNAATAFADAFAKVIKENGESYIYENSSSK